MGNRKLFCWIYLIPQEYLVSTTKELFKFETNILQPRQKLVGLTLHENGVVNDIMHPYGYTRRSNTIHKYDFARYFALNSNGDNGVQTAPDYH
jgi:hypothetical protein